MAAFRDGVWFVRGSITSGPADVCFVFGQAGDLPVVGDWDGDGLPTPGVFRPATGTWYLSNSAFAQTGADVVVRFGSPGDRPYPEDLYGDGATTVGVYRPVNSTFYSRNSNTDGAADDDIQFGNPGDAPVPEFAASGDLALYRSSTAVLYRLRSWGVVQALPWGNPGDLPFVPWRYGYDGDQPGFAGPTFGVYRPSENTIYPNVEPGRVVFGDPGDVHLGLAPRCTWYYCG